MIRAALYMVVGMIFLAGGYLAPGIWGTYYFVLAALSIARGMYLIMADPSGPGGVL